ncbi:MAG: DUF4143 domain-containing protein, partial [Gammaproteobacteria bacterium]|nr:DUF4143 domain-containing protein [Gammaproteobacteria bacterium]
ELIKHASETLAGRIFHIEMTPFALHETHQTRRLMERGGFPLSYLAETLSDSILWREQFITTFLERDIPKLGINIPSHTLRRFWMMLAHYHGNVLNASELGRSLGTNHITIQRYLDILAGTYMVRILPPWFENIQKRQVKSPKIYLRDAGIFQTLLSLNTTDAIFNHPKAGAFWEGFALEEILRAHEVKPGEAYFWSTHAEAELDLFVLKNNTRIGYEFKYADAPKRTKSMSIALNDLKLDELRVIYPGDTIYALDSKIVVMPLLEALNRKQ